MVRRNFIFKTIREVFEKYGYQPIETPAMENLETLSGKYGDEGDKLIFKILDSGDFFEPLKDKLFALSVEELNKRIHELVYDIKYKGVEYVEDNELLKKYIQIRNIKSHEIAKDISQKALRYDLTVPFARYVVQHKNEINFPFKRYQIQPVWRADKPQKGRYREFFQCDADVIGSDSLLNEVELVQIIDDVYSKLGIAVTIKVNNRKVLAALAEKFHVKTSLTDFIISIDKLEKIGIEGVMQELESKGFEAQVIRELMPLLDRQKYNPKNSFEEEIKWFKRRFSESRIEIGQKGIEEIEFIFYALSNCQLSTAILEFDITLARGLNYYTGAIFEVKANDVQIGSICGGGRYDDLTGVFGLKGVSGVGISFGIDRIFDVMNELNLFDKIGLTASTTKILFAHLGEKERNFCLQLAAQTRASGINTEIYPDVTKKIAKQFDYANKKQIPYVVVIGEEEMRTGELTLKEMSSGDQKKMKLDEIISKLK